MAGTAPRVLIAANLDLVAGETPLRKVLLFLWVQYGKKPNWFNRRVKVQRFVTT